MTRTIVARDQISKRLSEYAFHLSVWNNDKNFEVSLVGSATPLHYRNNYLLVCTKHQIRDFDPSDISLIPDDGLVAATSSGYTNTAGKGLKGEHDIEDVMVFDFNEACREHPSLRRKFFPFQELPNAFQDNDTIITFGFPSCKQKYDVAERNQIVSTKWTVVSKPHIRPNDATLFRCQPISKLKFDPDGISGGPNFVIQKSIAGGELYFAGVTVRAGCEDIYFVRSEYIQRLLDAFLEMA